MIISTKLDSVQFLSFQPGRNFNFNRNRFLSAWTKFSIFKNNSVQLKSDSVNLIHFNLRETFSLEKVKNSNSNASKIRLKCAIGTKFLHENLLRFQFNSERKFQLTEEFPRRKFRDYAQRAAAWRSSEKIYNKLQKFPKLSNAFYFFKFNKLKNKNSDCDKKSTNFKFCLNSLFCQTGVSSCFSVSVCFVHRYSEHLLHNIQD